ncbi:MAG: Thiol-disulfide oxidoreductase ResA [Pseudomonadota bacterium]|jgi:thiol-disulfide isomerase/thioredoxin
MTLMRVAHVLMFFLLFAVLPVASAGGLEVRHLDGRKSTLAAEIAGGHFTYVFIWTTYCGVCKQEYPKLSAFHTRHTGQNAEVLGIAIDGEAERDKVQTFMAGKPFSFPTVMAEPEAMAVAFKAATGEEFTGTPTYLVFNPERELAGVHSGDLPAEALERFLTRHASSQKAQQAP